MPESSSSPKSSHEEWIPLLLGLVFFTGGTWFWVKHRGHARGSLVHLCLRGVVFERRSDAPERISKTDYLSLVTPILVLSTMAAIYFIRMKGIREAYRMRGRLSRTGGSARGPPRPAH